MGAWRDAHDPKMADLVNTAPIVSDPVQITLDDLMIVQRYEVEIMPDALVEEPDAMATASDIFVMAHANRQRGCPVCGHDPVAHANICVRRTARTRRRTRYNSKRVSVR